MSRLKYDTHSFDAIMYLPDVPISYFGAAKPKAKKINDLQCLGIIRFICLLGKYIKIFQVVSELQN